METSKCRCDRCIKLKYTLLFKCVSLQTCIHSFFLFTSAPYQCIVSLQYVEYTMRPEPAYRDIKHNINGKLT